MPDSEWSARSSKKSGTGLDGSRNLTAMGAARLVYEFWHGAASVDGWDDRT